MTDLNKNQKLRVAIINDTQPTNHYGCLMVMKNLRSLIESFGGEVVWTWPVSNDWRKHKSQLLNFPNVDLVLVNGEGTIHHGPKRWQAQALAEFAEFAHNDLKVPAYLINATLYANEDSLNEHLKNYDAIYVRDRASHDSMNVIGINNQFVPDMTFALSSGLKHSGDKELCVVDSVMQSDLPKLKEFSKQNSADYCSMIVARPSNYSPLRKTRRFILEAWKWFFYEKDRSLNPTDFEAYLGQYKLIVTGRYHTVTMCLKNKIPFVAIESNTPKISYLLEEVFGNTNRLISINELIQLDVSKDHNYSVQELETIEKFLESAQLKNQNMLKSLLSKV